MIFINLSQAIFINQQQIELFGGSLGLRDKGLLASALEMPKQSYDQEYLHEFPFEMTAAYLFHISKNHPFLDGNKRTTLNVCLTFLYLNGFQCIMPEKMLEDFTVEVATGHHTKTKIAQKLEQHCVEI